MVKVAQEKDYFLFKVRYVVEEEQGRVVVNSEPKCRATNIVDELARNLATEDVGDVTKPLQSGSRSEAWKSML